MDEKSLLLEQTITAPMLSWMAVHGLLCLALRHPMMHGNAAREIALQFVAELGERLVAAGVLTPEELELAQRVEMGEQLEAACRICSCTNERACPGGCYWIEPDLCSRCGA